MPRLNYSPYDEQGIAQIGQSMQGLGLGLAQIRYQQQLQAQRNALAQQQMAMRGDVAHAQIGHYNAGAADLSSRAGINNAKLAGQAAFGAAMRRAWAAQHPASQPAVGIPTEEDAQRDAMANLYEQAGRNMALSGKAGEFVMPRNIGANQIAYTPASGELAAQGPVVLSPGSMYQFGGQQVTNPRPTTPEHVGNLMPAFVKAYTEGNLRDPSQYTPGSTNMLGKAIAPPSEADKMLWSTFTNLAQRVMSPVPQSQVSQGATQQQPGNPATAPKKPTRAIAAQYVSQYGRDAALAKMKQEGFDLTGYAD